MSSTSLSSTPSPATTRPHVERSAPSRLWRAGALAALLTAAANVVIRTIGVTVGAVPTGYRMLQPAPIVAASVVAALVATSILVALARWARRPVRTFRLTAVVILILSFGGPVQAGMGLMPGGHVSAPTLATMVMMHVVAATIIVSLLTTRSHGPEQRV